MEVLGKNTEHLKSKKSINMNKGKINLIAGLIAGIYLIFAIFPLFKGLFRSRYYKEPNTIRKDWVEDPMMIDA